MFALGTKLLLSTCCVILLGSCGSGAVTALDPAAGTPMTISPATADLTPNVPTTFTITGGRSPYSATSSNNTALPITATVTGSTFTVTANTVNADTPVDITVRDAVNTAVIAKATVKAGTALAVSPPTANLFADLPTTFTVTGGRPGYTVASSDNVVLPVTATITGSTFSVVPNAVTADTTVDITVRDAANTAVTAKATVKPSALLNQITFTPFGPTGTGCGTNTVCSGGDAQIVVKAVQNGVILRNRQIRFDVFQGNFQLVTPGTGVLVNSLLVNTDEQGEAVARITATVGAATQVATIQTTDVTSGLVRRYNFTIVQQVSGVGILSTLPSAAVTITGEKGLPGADGSCPVGTTVDYYIFGGAAPYTVVSPLLGVATVSPGVVAVKGGRFTAQVTGCGKVAFIVTDASGRTVETSTLEALRGAKGDAITTPPSLNVSVTSLPIACGASSSVTVSGSGSYTTTIVGTTGGLFVTPSADILVSTGAAVTIGVNRPSTFTNPRVDFVNGSITKSVAINVMTSTPGSCP